MREYRFISLGKWHSWQNLKKFEDFIRFQLQNSTYIQIQRLLRISNTATNPIVTHLMDLLTIQLQIVTPLDGPQISYTFLTIGKP